MLINTAFGVASVRKEWLNVATTLEVGQPAHRASGHPAGRRADHHDRHAHFHRHRLAGDRRRRDARGRNRHRLLRLERVEQPLDHQRDRRDPVHRPHRHDARPGPRLGRPPRGLPGIRGGESIMTSRKPLIRSRD